MIRLNYATSRKVIYLYMLIPLWCFIALYLRSLIGGIFLIFLYVISLFKIMKKCDSKRGLRICSDQSKDEHELRVQFKYLIVFGLVAVVWAFLGGQGNLYYQSADWDCRNAIYRDIIYRDWPVVYQEYNRALVYYIGYWLPAAAITKILGFIVPSIYLTDLAFQIGNIFLWLWTAIGIFLTELLLLLYSKPKQQYKILLVPVILVFFSGMDVIGAIRSIIKWQTQFWDIHIEWWCGGLQFSSLTTCLFWVFNQTIVPWLAILCVLMEEKLHNYVFIGICAFAAGPIPMLCIAVYMLLNGIYRGIISIINKDLKEFLKDVFSPVNCLAVLILPIFVLYYKSNQAINDAVAGMSSGVFSIFKLATITNSFIWDVFLFLILEVGVYLILLYRKCRKDIFYYLTIITSLVAPFVKIGNQSDFVARFSIPSVMVVAAMCLKYLINFDWKNMRSKIDKYVCATLCICLLIGTITPMTEFFRGYSIILQTGIIANVSDNLKTLNQDIPANNFTVHDYKNSLFFKYFFPDE